VHHPSRFDDAAIPRAFVEVARSLGQATVEAGRPGKRRRPR
jgi:hypothetical protein